MDVWLIEKYQKFGWALVISINGKLHKQQAVQLLMCLCELRLCVGVFQRDCLAKFTGEMKNYLLITSCATCT